MGERQISRECVTGVETATESVVKYSIAVSKNKEKTTHADLTWGP
jgi:hypothetical protein